MKGIGTVVTGSLRSGKLHVGDSMLHSGTQQKTKIRGLRLGTANIRDALAGQRAAANIGIDQNSITRGDWLLAPEQYVPVQRFDAKIRFISPDFKLRSSAQYHLYIGAAHHIVSIRCLNVEPEKFFQVASHQPFIAYHGDKFIIRDPSSQLTLGGGKVIDIFVPRRKRNS
ncbi:MAG: EF-Tu/IF-2/RF-3 family GTPase, partial [Pseudomonadota bacterium]|nr:EF-Tu/IF-2/RF-3 family GTPase [Pseudomonadota bacterium]